MHEAFADYNACTSRTSLTSERPQRPGPTSGLWLTPEVSEDLTGEVHDDGRILVAHCGTCEHCLRPTCTWWTRSSTIPAMARATTSSTITAT